MADKPFKAEYAKSSRASCKKCGGNIEKDCLRLAVMVQSPRFDGKVPQWHHFQCFWKRARPLTQADVDGFSELRSADQDRIKKHIEGGADGEGKSSGKANGGGAAASNTLPDFVVEYAKSNRSKCKGCDDKIEKDDVRISRKMINIEKPHLGMIDHWYHTNCFVEHRDQLGFLSTYGANQIGGFTRLNANDKKAVEALLGTVVVVVDGKRKAEDQVDEVAKKIKLESMKQKEEEDKMLKKQSNVIWSFKDGLKSCSDEIDLKELLIANKQAVPSGESAVLERLADGMAFGALLPCAECKDGQLVCMSDAYRCTGNISGWTKCTFSTKTPKRNEWIIPKEFKDVPFLKKYKYKQRERVFMSAQATTSPPRAATVATATVATAATKSGEAPGTSAGAVPGKLLVGKALCLVGKLQKSRDDIKALVEKLGGKMTSTVSKADFCISTKKEVEKMSKKIAEAQTYNVCVVAEDLLAEDSGRPLAELVSAHRLSTWGASIKVEQEPTVKTEPVLEVPKEASAKSSKRKSEGQKAEANKLKLTVKGRAAVDPLSNLVDVAHVLEDHGMIYGAAMSLVDVERGTNSYYKLQLLECDLNRKYWVFRSWGRLGTTIGGTKLEKMKSREDAVEHFCQLYFDKTGNKWNTRNFVKYPNKFYPVETDYGQDDEDIHDLKAMAGTNSKLAKPIQELLRMIFDIDSMKRTMVEFEIDLCKMPLGKLSRKQIQSAYSVLGDAQKLVSESGLTSLIQDLSNKFYTLIPHDFGMKKPTLLDNLDYIKMKVDMLDNLMDIEVAYSLLNPKDETSGGKKDLLDASYEKLHTTIEVLGKDTEEFRVILEYVTNTHAHTHDAYELEVEEVFKVSRDGEFQRYRPFRELHNRQLLWHGSRMTNYAGIFSKGLRIAPKEAPVTGYMFGKGVYFADMVSKSANYCHTSPSNPTGLILLAEVALGNMHELKQSESITKLPKGTHSVKGVGKTAPDPKKTVTLNGVQVPIGNPAATGINDTSLLYNEYIVYDVAQVNIKYLLKLNFKYKMQLW
ncbi:poly [ADP-ribose] polymerase 1 [Lethenteron reissneri]|uniref:poly [ADP-ribose] polymerase 1 n=1 Tax=Lethenteron reissneri TaxID=7753 RepID=UPI002AB66847|nr:poly [ADP-ribose] polymerase 1 [Lethenteron reissneri]